MAADALEAVCPDDFLALLVSAAMIGDGHLVDPELALGHLGGDLRLDAKAIAADGMSRERVGGTPCSTSPCRSG